MVDGSAGTLFLQDLHLGGKGEVRNEPGVGPLFIENILGNALTLTNPQEVWARQLNLESIVDPKITNNGGKFWVLGLKSEGRSSELTATGGSSTEVLGGFISLIGDIPMPNNIPAWGVVDSNISLIYAINSFTAAQFPTQILETRNGVTYTVLATSLPSRYAGSFMPLYAN